MRKIGGGMVGSGEAAEEGTGESGGSSCLPKLEFLRPRDGLTWLGDGRTDGRRSFSIRKEKYEMMGKETEWFEKGA